MRVLKVEKLEGQRRAFDIEVEDTHTYFVGNHGVLAHNCSLRYTNGQLVLAVTRGDGEEGEDITRNVRRMKGVQLTISNFTGHLRGEIILRKSDWKAHFPTYSNPRNAASGIAKRLDGMGSEHLTVLHYQMLSSGQPVTKSGELEALTAAGCATPNWTREYNLQAVEAVFAHYASTSRAQLDYDIDGLVIEFDSASIMETLGDLNRRPKGAIALKFEAEAKPTILRNIRWQVGKSGRITPVAEFDEVQLAGARVGKASLHNLSNIAEIAGKAGAKYFKAGDQILVSRRNDVIPFLEELLSSNANSATLCQPVNCPECNSLLVMEGEYLMCRGEDCPAQVLGSISRWCSKIGVLGMGDSVIEALIDAGHVTDIYDLYYLDPSKIEGVLVGGSRLGKGATTLVTELNSKKELALHTFVGSLGIPLCARSMCKVIVDAGFNDLGKMMAATVKQIAAIPGMGDTKAQSFVSGLQARRNLVGGLLDAGITIRAKAVGVLTGKSVCLTGFRSPDMEAKIEAAGGSLKGSVGAGLDYLVAKDPSSTSGKALKASQLGIKVISPDDMWKILN